MNKLLVLLTLLLPLSLHAETLHLVKKGRLTEHAFKQGNSWKEQKGEVHGKGTGQRLSLKRMTDASRFKITATLTLEKTGRTAAGVILGGDLFGFDGTKGLFLEGSGLGKCKLIKDTKVKIESGKEFKFSVESKDGEITFKINGKTVATGPYSVQQLGTIGLRPHRGHMRVSEFGIRGKFTELKPLGHLFACGKEGYKSYRIPALVTTKKGTLLAFCEGRKHGSGDHGDIDIVFKRSTDNGKTWSPVQIAFDNHNHVAGNPAPIVDQKTGRIHLLSCTSDKHEYAIYQGNGRRGIFSQHSDDDGKTWSKPRDISANIYPDNWRWYATGPCSGIQIQEGAHAGRLVCPANHTIVEEGDKNIFRAHSIYSDDNGKTWQLGESSEPGGNESSLAEAGKGVLYQSIRMQSHRQGMRGTRYSQDGGESWTPLKHDFNLPCPMCQGAVIRDYSQPNTLVHSNPGTRKGRAGMTIRISEDGGKTWPHSKLILPTSSAYSDLAITANNQIAILYEGGHHGYSAEGIIFELHSKESITKPAKSQKRATTTPADKMGWALWKERQEKFNARAKKGDVDLLLLGDSITHYWQKNKMSPTDGQTVWDKYFKDKKSANFGIGSDRTQHLLYRLQNGNLDGIQPKYAVIMIGTNNVTSKHSPYDIYLGTKAVIDTIHAKSPNTTILLYDIFPRNRGGAAAWNHCEQANQLTASLCDGKKVIRCSINKQLLDANGQPNKAIFFDGIHISPEGYEIWAQDILKNAKDL